MPLDALSREQKILLLKRLRSKLCSLVAALTAKQSGAPITRVPSLLPQSILGSLKLSSASAMCAPCIDRCPGWAGRRMRLLLLQVHGTPVKDTSAAPERLACEGSVAQPLPMAPLDPALTVAQQRMNTQGAAKRRRGPALKRNTAAPKQRCTPGSRHNWYSILMYHVMVTL